VLGKSKTDPGVKWDELLAVLRAGGRRAAQVRDYCQNDAALVEEMYEHSRLSMERAGVHFEKPISCASIAVQKFSKSMAHDVPREVNNAFEKTYRGGRIECPRVGYFPTAYLYDIHSAYPSVMSNLCQTSGQWLPVEKQPRPDALYAAVSITLHIPRDLYRCPVPVKGETQLMYPYGQWSQWVDLETYRVLENEGFVRKIRRGYQLIADGVKRPFAALAEMYDERQRQPAQSWALKIIMNALYGKVAERIGKWFPTQFVNRDSEAWRGQFWTRREQWTKRTNFVYASAITAGIRLRMYREIPPETTIFYATDGVMLMKPITEGLDVGPGLGQWSEPEVVRDLVVVGSGVYTYKATHCDKCKAHWEDALTACPACGKPCVHTKMRGFEVGLDLYQLLDRRRRILTLNVRRNWTLAQSIRQRKYSMFNELVDVPRYLDVCFDRKRIWERDRTGRDLLQGNFTSRPWAHYPDVTYEEF
jgi:DNA polymerase family B